MRATYSVSTDEKIDLYSPYIPNDVTWTVNGVEISSESIETKSLNENIYLGEITEDFKVIIDFKNTTIDKDYNDVKGLKEFYNYCNDTIKNYNNIIS